MLLQSEELAHFFQSTSRLAQSACTVAWGPIVGLLEHPCLVKPRQLVCHTSTHLPPLRVPSPAPMLQQICLTAARLATQYVIPFITQQYLALFQEGQQQSPRNDKAIEHGDLSSDSCQKIHTNNRVIQSNKQDVVYIRIDDVPQVVARGKSSTIPENHARPSHLPHCRDSPVSVVDDASLFCHSDKGEQEGSNVIHGEGDSTWVALPLRSISELEMGTGVTMPKELRPLLDTLCKRALRYCERKGGAGVEWKPEHATQRLLDKIAKVSDQDWNEHRTKLLESQVLLWMGSRLRDDENGGSSPSYYGHDVPLFKVTGVVHMSPSSLAKLLLDSARVTYYNRWTLGRKDVVVYQDTLFDEGSKGAYTANTNCDRKQFCTKLVHSESKLPFTDRTMTLTNVMHARRAQDGYLIVSRSVTASTSNSSDFKPGTEIMLGANYITHVEGRESEDICEMTAISHMKANFAPRFMAKKIGVTGLTQFFDRLRKIKFP
jgi:hypothetical protein